MKTRFALRAALAAAALALPLWATLDRDHDGVSDIWSSLHPSAIPPEADADGDGASNRAEAAAGTDPAKTASHLAATPAFDALGNLTLRWPSIPGKRYQVEATTDLRNWAPLPGTFIGDGSTLAALVRPAGTNAARLEFWRIAVSAIDSDQDGLDDWEEAQLGTSPTNGDTDADGLPDAWEAAYGLDPTTNDSGGDPDHDAFTNTQEFATGQNPTQAPVADATGTVALCIFQPRR